MTELTPFQNSIVQEAATAPAGAVIHVCGPRRIGLTTMARAFAALRPDIKVYDNSRTDAQTYNVDGTGRVTFYTPADSSEFPSGGTTREFKTTRGWVVRVKIDTSE